MPISSVGDMSQHFLSLRNSGSIKSDLSKLGQELSTGRVSDIAAHLEGSLFQYSGVVHSLKMLDAYMQSSGEASVQLEQTQLALGKIENIRSQTAEGLLTITETSLPTQIEHASSTARSAFTDMVSTMNGKYLGRNILGGTIVDRSPLADANTMLSSIVSEIGSGATTATIIQVLDDWFESPAGGFSTLAYRGDTGEAPGHKIGPDQTLSLGIRADDKEFKTVLKASALVAILTDLPVALSSRDAGYLAQKAGVDLLAAATGTAHLQSKIGYLQETVSTAQTQMTSERAALGMLENNMTTADPFETATKLEAVRTQLETHFAVASRLSRLSLLEFI